MKISDILEALSPKSAKPVLWRKSKLGFWGPFFVDDKSFVIELSRENPEEIEARYGLKLSESLKSAAVWRVDFSQLHDDKFVYTDTGNLGAKDALAVFATVAHETAAKLKDERFKIIYFAAKTPRDDLDNPRKRIYPNIARMMSKTTKTTPLVFEHESGVVSMLVRGINLDDLKDLWDQVDDPSRVGDI